MNNESELHEKNRLMEQTLNRMQQQLSDSKVELVIA